MMERPERNLIQSASFWANPKMLIRMAIWREMRTREIKSLPVKNFSNFRNMAALPLGRRV
jgi:hypothetical protein